MGGSNRAIGIESVFPEMFLDVIISISPDENVPNKVTDVFV